MAEEKKITETEVDVTADKVEETKKSDKKEAKKDSKPNFFVRIWKKLVKLTKDTIGELKKVTWTPKTEVFKNFKLVIATVVAVGVAIAVVDVVSSLIINSIAGLIG